MVAASVIAYSLRRILSLPATLCVVIPAALVAMFVATSIIIDGGSIFQKWGMVSVWMAFAFWGAGAGLIGLGAAIWRE